MSAEDPVVAARRHLTQLLGMRDENVHRDGKFLPIARDAWQALSPNNMWREHVLAFLDLAKTRKNDAAKADDYLWTAFVLACYNRMDIIGMELTALLTQNATRMYIIPNADTWLKTHWRAPETIH